MKLSISLSESDVEFVDEFGRRAGLATRSAVLQRALATLRALDLQGEYEQAFADWDASADGPLWEATTGDGLPAR